MTRAPMNLSEIEEACRFVAAWRDDDEDLRIPDNQFGRTLYDATGLLCNEVPKLIAALRAVEEALSGHPECDVHPGDDPPITCGWKRAVADVRQALSGIDTGRQG